LYNGRTVADATGPYGGMRDGVMGR
jgi:hypothetical protein